MWTVSTPTPGHYTQRPCAHLSASQAPCGGPGWPERLHSQRPVATRWASEAPGWPGAGCAVGCRAEACAPSAAVAPARCPSTGSPEARGARLWEMARVSSTPATAEGWRLTGRRPTLNVPSCGSRPRQGASLRTRTGAPARPARGSPSCSLDSAPARSQTALPGSRRRRGSSGWGLPRRELSSLILEAPGGQAAPHPGPQPLPPSPPGLRL